MPSSQHFSLAGFAHAAVAATRDHSPHLQPAPARFFTLACVTCGSAVDISRPMDRFSCEHCGMLQAIDRTTGGVSLKPFSGKKDTALPAKTVQQAELASLRKAVIDAENKRRQKKIHWRSIRATRLAEWRDSLTAAARGAASVKRMTAMASIFPAALIAAAAWGIARENMAADIAVVAAAVTVPVSCVLIIVLVNEFLKGSDHYGVRRLKRECSIEFAKMDGRIAAEMRHLEKRIFRLKLQLTDAEYRVKKAG